MATGIRKPGEFCWINMLTPRPDEARAFFGELLGWTYLEMPGMGHRVQVQGHDIGGLFDLLGPNTPPGMPPLIGVMVKVSSADRAAEKVKALGGQAMPAFDIMDQGRMAVCFDPNGAQFDVWEPKKGPGTDVDSSLPGAPSWFETLTTDALRAKAFYSELFGWTPEVFPGTKHDYTTFKSGGAPVAGMMKITPEMECDQAHWGVYFSVMDADKSLGQALELGARACVPVTDIPNVGRFCGLTSPQGVVFYLIEYIRASG
jgi:predicted enzyme related to lactoylglutathione lyase